MARPVLLRQMMNGRLVALSLALLVASPAARAQVTSAEAEAAPPPSGSESGLRTGLDFGLTGGAAPTSGSYQGTVVGAVGFGLDLGHQFDRSWGLFGRLELGTAIVSNYAGSYLMLEYTPSRQLSVAAGAGAEAGVTIFVGNYAGVAFPVRVSWNFLSEETWATRRGNDCWRLSLLVVGGNNLVDGSSTGFVRGALTLGYAWM